MSLRNFIFLCILFLILAACRYSRSVLSYRTHVRRSYFEDSTLTEIRKSYRGLSLNGIDLRTGFVKKKTFNPKGILIRKEHTKRVPWMVYDPPFNGKKASRIIYYNDAGRKTKITYSTIKFYKERGREGKVFVNKEITYNEKGQKIKINLKKEDPN